MLSGRYKDICICFGVVTLAFSIYYGLIGIHDIYATHGDIRYNQQVIEECKEKGITDITLVYPTAETKYSPANGLKYLDTEDPKSWPNNAMDGYYGVDSLIGVWR